MKVLHLVFVGIAMLCLVVAAPAAIGVADAEPQAVSRQVAAQGGTRYVFLGGFYGGK